MERNFWRLHHHGGECTKLSDPGQTSLANGQRQQWRQPGLARRQSQHHIVQRYGYPVSYADTEIDAVPPRAPDASAAHDHTLEKKYYENEIHNWFQLIQTARSSCRISWRGRIRGSIR